MQEGKFSRTAERVAIRRAAHQLLDHPKVFDDPLALAIIGAEAAAALRLRPKEDPSFSRAFRAFMVARSRYAEDELSRAVATGVNQYVVLGAGLDTFAYRNPYPDLRIFEIDHPATQSWKRERLQTTNIPIPPSLTFVPVNFEQQTLAGRLQECGFRRDAPAFFSWLGVTPYLTHDACMSTLDLIATMPRTSGVVFDFAIDRQQLNPGQRIALDALAKQVASAGEPFQLFLDPQELEKDLKKMGFHRTEFLAGEAINTRYFSGRSDKLRVRGGIGHLMGAWV